MTPSQSQRWSWLATTGSENSCKPSLGVARADAKLITSFAREEASGPFPCLFALAVTAIGSRRRQERMIATAMIDSMTRLGATMLRNAHHAVGVPSSFVSRSRRVARMSVPSRDSGTGDGRATLAVPIEGLAVVSVLVLGYRSWCSFLKWRGCRPVCSIRALRGTRLDRRATPNGRGLRAGAGSHLLGVGRLGNRPREGEWRGGRGGFD